MMLTGKNIRADKAKRMGLVDMLVNPLGIKHISNNIRVTGCRGERWDFQNNEKTMDRE